MSFHNMVETVLLCIMVYVDYISARVYIGSFAVFRNFEKFEIDIALAEYSYQQTQIFISYLHILYLVYLIISNSNLNFHPYLEPVYLIIPR